MEQPIHIDELKRLFSQGTLRLLIYLDRVGKSYTMKIHEDLSGSLSTWTRAKKLLGEFGLIEEKEDNGRSPRKWICLTPNGKKFLKLIIELDELI